MNDAVNNIPGIIMNEALQEIGKRSLSFSGADFLPTVLGEFCTEAITGARPVVLYGAGSAGKELFPVLQRHGVAPVCFCDSNPSRVGKNYCGLPIISMSDLQLNHKESVIVVSIGAYSDQIKQQLIEAGFDKGKVLTVDNQEALYYYCHVAQWYWPEEDLAAHADDLLKVYNILSDQKSRDIFASRIALFAGGADFKSYQNFISKFSDAGQNVQPGYECSPANCDSEAYLQFNNDLLKLKNDEVLFDGGAFTGDSTLEFIKACDRQRLIYKEIVCFEPDPLAFAQLRENTVDCANISLRPFGLWSHATTITFADSNILAPGSTRIISGNVDSSVEEAAGITEIHTTTIDEEISENRVTLIKMDIEGAEIEALRGALQTIARDQPKLIISAYHKRDDIFEIPLLIQQMVPEYKLYFRHFSNCFNETTLFAIPDT
jgi:FkbM family methyltransferase